MKIKLLSIIFLLPLVSCATFVEGTKEEINIFSEPLGATVIVDSKVCVTPCDIVIKKKTDELLIQKKGLNPKKIKIKKKISPFFWWNILFFPPGMLIDYKTGAMWDLPDEINVKLENGFLKKESK